MACGHDSSKSDWLQEISVSVIILPILGIHTQLFSRVLCLKTTKFNEIINYWSGNMARTVQFQVNHTTWISTCPVRKQSWLRIRFTCFRANRTDDRWNREAFGDKPPSGTGFACGGHRQFPSHHFWLILGKFCVFQIHSSLARAWRSACSPTEVSQVVQFPYDGTSRQAITTQLQKYSKIHVRSHLVAAVQN